MDERQQAAAGKALRLFDGLRELGADLLQQNHSLVHGGALRNEIGPRLLALRVPLRATDDLLGDLVRRVIHRGLAALEQPAETESERFFLTTLSCLLD